MVWSREAPSLKEIALHRGNARTSVRRTCFAVRLGGLGSKHTRFGALIRTFRQILVNLGYRQSETRADRGLRILGVDRRPQFGLRNSPLEHVEINDIAAWCGAEIRHRRDPAHRFRLRMKFDGPSLHRLADRTAGWAPLFGRIRFANKSLVHGDMIVEKCADTYT